MPNDAPNPKHSDLKVVERLNRLFCEPGQEPELVKETEWEYVFKTGAKSYGHVSKFLDETFSVEASSIRERWPKLEEAEQMRFASNFWNKPTWNENDTEILEILMQNGDDRVWGCCALAFLKHPDRDRAVTFLITRLQNYDDKGKPLNYIQALGLSKDHRATPVIRPYYEKFRKGVESEATLGVPEDIFFGPIPYSAFFAAAGALLKIEGSSEYEDAIRKYLDHPHEQIRWWAEHALEIEGPATAKRKVEYKKRHAKE